MSSPDLPASLIHFGEFAADLETGELHRDGTKVKLQGQPFEILALLLKRPGRIVAREELRQRLWPSDTFVDFEHGLNAAVNRLREALGDSAEMPRFIETVPRRGYRFVAAIEGGHSVELATEVTQGSPHNSGRQFPAARLAFLFGAIVAAAGVGFFAYKRANTSPTGVQRSLTRLTFDAGLQIGATWSPDGRYIAYSSDHGGKFDIWVRQVSGGNPIQVTHQPGDNWQPDWSPDGNFLVYRSEQGEGGLFVVPSMGGEGQERKISSFGYRAQWSPDGSRILFQAIQFASRDSFYVVGLGGESPQPVLTDFFANHPVDALSAAWHPSGKRISVSLWNGTPIPEFWTAAIGGADAVKTEIDPAITARLAQASANYSIGVELADFKFCWAPSGDAIYFERTFRGVKNLWRMTIDRATLRGVGIERLTTGAGPDTELAVSPDGKKLAFSTEAVHVAVWLFPFQSTSGRITGNGMPINAPGSATWSHAVTRDGSKIALQTERAGKLELWEKSLADNQQPPVLVDDHAPRNPVWSPDGKRLAYYCEKSGFENSEIDVWSSELRSAVILTSTNQVWNLPHDWSPDGRELLIAQKAAGNNVPVEIWSLPTSQATDSQLVTRKVLADGAYDLFQPHFSPDGRWIVFEAVSRPAGPSLLYVVSARGGRWTPVPVIGTWADKPRWSPDGKLIYFLSERHGFFNVWAIRFDELRGVPVGKPFRITNFESPKLMVPTYIPPVELSVTRDKLALNLAEVSGSIWMLDNVDR